MSGPDFIQQQSHQHRENQISHQLHDRNEYGIPDDASEARQGKEIFIIIQPYPFLIKQSFQRGVILKSHGDSHKGYIFKNKGNYHRRQKHEVERYLLPKPAFSFLHSNSFHIIPPFL